MTTISETTTDQLRSLIKDELPDLIAIRHDLHAHPELGYEEKRTSEVVQHELKSAGVDFREGLAGGTGVLGHIPTSNGNGRAIGLRADMDALPIEEQTGVSYASRHPGKMHACGHDGHTTILLGAARVLAKLAGQSPLPRPVTFFFQPAEEGGAGAKRMIDDGCMSGKVVGPPIAEMFGLHGWPWMPLGNVGTRPGPLLAASDRFDIVVKGTGTHAAWPHKSHDPIVAAAAIINALQSIVSRNVNPLDAVVISTTIVNAGSAYNVIPTEAKISGTVRTLTAETQSLAEQRLNDIATMTARAHDCEADVEFRRGYPVTLNDSGATKTFMNTAAEALGPQHVVSIDQPVMGGEDFSFYCHEVPSCFFVLGLIPPGKSSMPELHQPQFDFNDDAIATGVEMFCRLALRG